MLDRECNILRTLEIGNITATGDAVLVHDDSLIIADKSGLISIWNLEDG